MLLADLGADIITVERVGARRHADDAHARGRRSIALNLKDNRAIDLVRDLVAHARQVAGRPDGRFEVVDHIAIPQADGTADMVCFFSVLTHLLHEQSYWYLEEAKRVLKPGGRIVFSFLEYREPGHMPIFWGTLQNAKARTGEPLNVFIDRDGIQRWADALALRLEDIRMGSEQVVAEGVLGQSVCMLEKPA
jgi:SAM-dependent methyltransferase